MDESQAKDLAAKQASLALAIDELRAALSAGAVTDWAKAAAADKAKQATLDSSGKPKVWVLITVSLVLSITVMGLVMRLTGGKGKSR